MTIFIFSCPIYSLTGCERRDRMNENFYFLLPHLFSDRWWKKGQSTESELASKSTTKSSQVSGTTTWPDGVEYQQRSRPTWSGVTVPGRNDSSGWVRRMKLPRELFIGGIIKFIAGLSMMTVRFTWSGVGRWKLKRTGVMREKRRKRRKYLIGKKRSR